MPPMSEPAPAVAPVDRSEPFQAVLLVGPNRPEGTEGPKPLPVGAEPAPNQPDSTETGERIVGIYCKNDHFNDPNAPYCGVCGISMVQLTHVAREGIRPPLGVLVLDDGGTFRLDTSYVVGREPERDAEVSSGKARALRINDPDGVVSRVHARVQLDGWDVNIVDQGSANGTHISELGSNSWTRIQPNTPTKIKPGTRVLFGRRGFRYESHRNP